MWFGTQDGLNRYDGINFRIFRHDLQDEASISDNNITAIYEDKFGNLWIGTVGGGLNKFDCSTEKFKSYTQPSLNGKKIEIRTITSICGCPANGSNVIYIGTEHRGIFAFDIKQERFLVADSVLSCLSQLNSYSITKLLGSKDHTSLWAGTGEGVVYRIELLENSFLKYNVKNEFSSNSFRITDLYQDQDDIIWAGTENGLYIFRPEADQFQKVKTSPVAGDDPNVKAIFVDHKDFVWIGTWGKGIRRFDKKGKSYFEYKHDPGYPSSLVDDKIFSIKEDRFGTIWIGTWAGGISKYDISNDEFLYFRHQPGVENSISSNDVMAVLETEDNNLWAGTTDGGLNRFDDQNKTITHFEFQKYKHSGISDNTIICILESFDKKIWIGTWAGGLDQFDPRTERFKNYRHNSRNPLSLSDNSIWSLIEDQNHNLWVGTRYGGLNKLNAKSGKFTHYSSDPEDITTLSDNGIPSLLEDQKGSIWIGTNAGGLNVLELGSTVFKHFMHNPDVSGSLSDNCVWSLHEDRKGNLWVGTKTGLNKFQPETKTFQIYSEDDGLPNNVIYSIEEDRNGFLWLSTNRGLSKFDPVNETFENFDESDGLQSNEFNLGASCTRKNGELVFGGINGFNMFNPADVRGNLFAPEVVLTDFQIFNKTVPIGKMQNGRKLLSKSITQTQEINLTSQDKIFSFEFAALHYSKPEQNQYAYIMEGFEKDWNYVSSRNFALYTNIPEGNYTFRVKASNNRSVWNENGLSLSITMSPEFWSTWWFRLIIVLVVLGVVLLLHRLRLLNIKAHNKELSKINSELNNQMKERMSIETALRESENKINSIFRSAPVGIGFVTKTILEVNNKICEISGYSREELIGGTSQIFYATADDLENVIRETEKQISETGLGIVETQWVHKDKRKIDVLIYSTPIELEDWSKGTLFSVLDITDRKKAEAAMQESEEKYRNLIEQSGDAIYLLYKRKFEIVNEKFISVFKVTREYVADPEFDFIDLVAPSSRWIIDDRIKRQKNGEILDPKYEFTAIRSDGEEIEVEASVSYIQYREGIATQGIIRDITERKKLEAQLRQAQKMEAVGQLAGGVAHDFNNLLTVINGYCDLLMFKKLPKDIQDQIDHIHQASKKATRLTSQLLAFSRRQMIQPKHVQLNNLVSDYLKMLGRLLGEDIEIITIPDPELKLIFVDPGQIEQIIMNLAVNSRDAMPYGGKLIIETKNIIIDENYVRMHNGAQIGSYVMLVISDNGVGMDEKTRSHIFEPFFTTKGRDRGTGLGLATVYGIIKQNNGFIYVYSETGNGTTFKIYLPVAQSNEDKKFSKPEAESLNGTGTILLVEDDSAVREVTQSTLEGYGYKVITAENGEQALNYYKKNGDGIDLLLTDVIMPVMSGKELSNKLRKINKELKILFFSGYTDNAIVHHGVLDKEVNFLQKPYSNVELAKKVKALLS